MEVKIDKSKFRVKANNRLKTWALFLESPSPIEGVVFHTGYDHRTVDGRTIYSFYKLFLEMGDVTGTLFALEYLDGIDHWERLRSNKELTPLIDKCTEHVRLRIVAENIVSINSQAENGSFQAAKYMAEGGYDKRKVGRPSKADIAKINALDKKLSDDYADALDNMGLQ